MIGRTIVIPMRAPLKYIFWPHSFTHAWVVYSVSCGSSGEGTCILLSFIWVY